MKNLKQISSVLLILLISGVVIGLIAWRFAANRVSLKPDMAATSVSVTEPVVAAVTGYKKGLYDHDELMETPSPEIINAIREIKKPTPDEGQVIESPDGSMKMKPGNSLRSVPIATIDKDGKIHVDYHGEKYLENNKKVEEKKL